MGVNTRCRSSTLSLFIGSGRVVVVRASACTVAPLAQRCSVRSERSASAHARQRLAPVTTASLIHITPLRALQERRQLSSSLSRPRSSSMFIRTRFYRKSQLLVNAAHAFGGDSTALPEVDRKQLHAKIGQQQALEIDFLAGTLNTARLISEKR